MVVVGEEPCESSLSRFCLDHKRYGGFICRCRLTSSRQVSLVG